MVVSDGSDIHRLVYVSWLGILVTRVTHLNYPALGGGKGGWWLCEDHIVTGTGSQIKLLRIVQEIVTSQDLHDFSFFHGIFVSSIK